MFPALKFWMLIKFDFSSITGILVVKFAFATANLKIETLRTRRRFARVFSAVDIAFIMSSSTSAWLLSPLGCSPQKQNG